MRFPSAALVMFAVLSWIPTASAKPVNAGAAAREPVNASAVERRAVERTLGAAAATRLWSDDMESGSLSAWSVPPGDDFGGGVYNSGGGFAVASTEQHRSGAYSAKLELPDGKGGTRLFRWRELRNHRTVAISVWLYFPLHYTVGGHYFNVFQIKSRRSSGATDPIWYLDVVNAAPGRMRFRLVWWHRTLEGPRPRQSGLRRFTQNVADVPVGRWFQIKAVLRQSNGFDGTLVIWQDGRPLFQMTGVRTSYANCEYNAWCTSNEWAVNNYSDGLQPAPSVLYVDDAQIDALAALGGAGDPFAGRAFLALTGSTPAR